MKRALINIDYSNDFVHNDGKLSCKESAQLLEENILNLTKEFYYNDEYIVFAIDLHNSEDSLHPESKLFPEHNIQNSWGRKLYESLENFYQEVRNSKNIYYMDKTRYSAFAGTNLFIKLQERKIEEIHLTGVCTDICILHTAIDAYNLGFKIVIHEDCVASFDKNGHEFAINHFKNILGASLL